MSATFQQRLNRLLADGNLTVADLARWLERPHPTVRGWVMGGNLGGAGMDAAYVIAEITRLEKLIKKKRGLPVPRMSARKRMAYMSELRRRL